MLQAVIHCNRYHSHELFLIQATASTTQILNVANDAKRDLLSALLSVQDTGVYGLEVGHAPRAFPFRLLEILSSFLVVLI